MSMYCLARYNDCQYEKERYHLARLMLRGRNKVLVTILSVLMMSCPRSAELTSRQVLGWDKETPYAQEGNHSSISRIISAGNNKLYLACLDTRWGSSDILLLGQSLCVSWGDKVRLRLNRTGVGDRLVVSSLALRCLGPEAHSINSSSTELWFQGLYHAFLGPPEVLAKSLADAGAGSVSDKLECRHMLCWDTNEVAIILVVNFLSPCKVLYMGPRVVWNGCHNQKSSHCL